MNFLPIAKRLGAGLGIALLASSAQTAQAQLRGAGATFPAPIYAQWFAKFQKETGGSVDYQAVGSGAGISAIRNKTVDFGASDAPLSPQEEAAFPAPVVHIPTVGGAVVLTYNLPGHASGLRFTSDIIADIFLGKIKTWNDPRIKAANPGQNLPDTAIQPVHRTDGSGTTYIFTNYLRKANADWAAGPGAGKSVSWPVGLGGKGSPGVSALVQRTPGSIAYVELAYAITYKLPYGQVRNQAGKFIEPSVESTTAAIEQYAGELAKNIKAPTVDAKGPNSYPICSLTYIILYRNGGAKSGKLLSWVLQPAQQNEVRSLVFAPLPPALVKINQAAIASLR